MPEQMSGGPQSDEDLSLDLPPIDDDAALDDDLDDHDGQEFDRQLDALEREDRSDDDGAPDAALDIGELLANMQEPAPDRDDDARELDVGDAASELGQDDAPLLADDDEGGIAGEDSSGDVPDLPALGDDVDDTKRGTDALDDEIDEAAFPELDSDDERDLPGALDAGDLELPDEAPALPWAQMRWERVNTPLVAVPMACVSVADDAVIAAGEGTVRLTTDPLGALNSSWVVADGIAGVELVACSASTSRSASLLLGSSRSLFRSRDGGRSFQIVHVPLGVPPAKVAMVSLGPGESGLAYALRTDGVLLVSADDAASWREMDVAGPVAALCKDESAEVHLLVRDPAGVRLLDNDRTGHWTSKQVAGVSAWVHMQRATHLARRADVIAIGGPSGAVCVSWDAGDSWQVMPLPHALCALAVVASDTVVGAVYVESEDKSYLVRIPRNGSAELVADLSPDVTVDGNQEVDESEGVGQATALAWDDARGLLWVAGRFGLMAWRTGFAS